MSPPPSIGEREHMRYLVFVHGIVMVIAFAILFPVGATLLRLFRMKHLAWFHGVWQLVAWALAISGFATGVYISKHGGHGTFKSPNGHKQIGLLVIILMFLMPFLGAIHHALWKKNEAPTVYGRVHRWLGRTNLTMGGINVGLGVMLSRAAKERTIAYSVLTGFFFLIYFVVLCYKGPEAQKCKTTAVSGESTKEPSLRTVETEKIGKPGDGFEMKEGVVTQNAEPKSEYHAL